MKNIIFILMVLFATSVCFSQSNFWKKSKLNSPEYSSYVKNLQKDKYQIFSLDYDKLKAKLVNAPSRTNQSSKYSVVVNFPDEKGNMERFKVYETFLLAQAVAIKYPNIKTYIGFSLDNPGARIRFSVTPQGVKTMTSYLNKPTLFTVPLGKGNT